ncbi:hypothetical protein CA267_001735 [Alteromonas pelagimontana]|uniref:Uncharacterized protein n=1 Tax=Alteromonas pelagimontana TaxID=1858656 RepID=A0A6M4MAL2_9ALTE|nr:hypothetical protein [Alteromonas pelagimontana]QJR79605.1 hypothetical protein CA267_001735 [Alteromonas pelagimontana]
MQALANEVFTPKDQEGAQTPKTYTIKALKPLQLTEAVTAGMDYTLGRFTFSFPAIITLLKYGLEDQKLIESMPAAHHAVVAKAIYEKSSLADEERKNS